MQTTWVKAVLLMVGLLLCTDMVLAQRPFQAYDPFYRDESARRSFFDGYAVTAELSYRPPGSLSGSVGNLEGITGAQALRNTQSVNLEDAIVPSQSGAIGITFFIDYELASQWDISAIIDAAGSLSGRSTALTWIAVKRYWYADANNLAIPPRFRSTTRSQWSDWIPANGCGLGLQRNLIAHAVYGYHCRIAPGSDWLSTTAD